MHFISIGPNCILKKQISKHIYSTETLFFDWILTNMSSVISILETDNIEKILNIDNVIRDIKTSNHGKIIVKSLSYCVAIHDAHPDLDETEDISNFIEKYKRRYSRIIQYVLNNEKIYFLRFDRVNESDKQKFIEIILKINPNCNFTLVSINTSCKEKTIIKSDYYLEINLIDKLLPNSDWTHSYLDWEQIFKDIKNF
jgi:hypothetical protein